MKARRPLARGVLSLGVPTLVIVHVIGGKGGAETGESESYNEVLLHNEKISEGRGGARGGHGPDTDGVAPPITVTFHGNVGIFTPL